MMKSVYGRCVLFLLVAALAACTTKPVARTTVDRVLKAPEVPNAPYTNILLVGIAPSRDLARELEEGLRQELLAEDIVVHTFVRDSSAKEATAEAVQALASDSGADAILMISGRLTGGDLDEHAEVVDIEARSIGGNLVNFFRYDYEELAEPTYTDITLDIVLVSLLFDAASNERVHSVEASTLHGDSSYQIVTAQADAIVERMKKDGMIR